MSDGNDNNDDGQKPSAGGRAPLTLKPRDAGSVPAGTVRQSFSHGRSKTVVVETKRRREPGVAPQAVFPAKRPVFEAPKPAPRPQAPSASAPSGGAAASRDPGNLSAGEMEARRRAIELARQEQERRDSERHAQDAAQRAQEEAARRAQDAARAAAAASAPPPAPVAQAAPSVAAPAVARPVAAAPVAQTPSVQTPSVQAPVVQAPVAQAPVAATLSAQAPTAQAAPRPAPEAPAAPQPGYGQRAPRPESTLGFGQRAPRPDAPPREPREPARTAERPAPPREAFRGDRPGNREGVNLAAPRGDRPQGDRPQGGGYASAPRGDRPAGGGFAGAPRGDRPQGGGFAGSPRGERPASGGFAGAPRGDRPQGGGFAGAPRGDRPPREGGETVRYSALAPRPAGPRDGPRPGGPRPPGGARPGAAGAAPAGPEVARPARTGIPGARPSGVRRPDDDDDNRKRAGAAPAKAVSRTKGEPKRREGRLTIQTVAGDEDTAERMRSLASVRRAREREKEKRKGGSQEQAKAAREVVIPDVITVQELGNRMATRAVDIIKFLMRQGMMLKINDVIDNDTAELVATEFGHTVRRVSEADVEEGFLDAEDDAEDTMTRPPVVAIMGHVDHGKTSLLDALRATDVVAGEAGGITQHIGAYQVRLENGERVTFLDTPGHAAFSAMRARGANVTDIVVLVVAADDGVMPQTIEAINHARAANTPIIVAVNKMDKPGADSTRVVNELLQHEIVAESLGGETQIIEVSATKKMGLDNLIEAILLQAEVMDLRANSDRTAEGVVIEAKLDKGRGPVATVLLKRGTLKRGEIVVAGANWGKVRALINERDEQLTSAGPSDAVEILGLDGAPDPGEAFAVVENEARAREITEYRERKRRERNMAPAMAGVSLSDMMAKLQDKQLKELPIVIKADVQGSAEAITGSLAKLATEEVRARVILSGVGGITESDVLLAKGANAPIIGFNVRASRQARDLAEREGVEIRYYAIIYDLIDDIKGVLSGMLSPIQRETFLGNAEVLEAFDISKVGKVAGCKVTEGVMRRGAKVRIVRNDVVIQEMGTLQTLKRFKDDVSEVISGQECGMSFAGFQDIKPGDLIECFTVESIARTL
jgi:translation initiation factor IF-2